MLNHVVDLLCHFRGYLLAAVTNGVVDVSDDDGFFFEVDVGFEIFVCVVVFFEGIGWEPLTNMVIGGDLFLWC